MKQLRDKLEQAMKPRKKPRTPDSDPASLDSRYEKADQIMDQAATESSTVPPKDPTRPVKRRRRRKRKGNLVIRDTFSFPRADIDRIAALRKRARRGLREASKSEIVRAGLLVLESLSAPEFLAALGRVERVKTGRPPKKKEGEEPVAEPVAAPRPRLKQRIRFPTFHDSPSNQQ